MVVAYQRGGGVYGVRDGDRFAPFNAVTGQLGLWGPEAAMLKWGYWNPFSGTPSEAAAIVQAVKRLTDSTTV